MKVVYRVVCALLAIAVLPVMFFQPLVRIVYSPASVHVEETVSIQKAIDLFSDGGLLSGLLSGDDGSKFVMTDSLKSLMPALITTGVFLVISIVLALVIFFFAALSNKKKLILILSGAGFLSTIGAFIAFGQASSPITSGEMPITSLVDMGILASIISSFVNIDLVQLSSAAVLLIIIFVVICVWSLCFILPELGEQEKPVRIHR